MRHSHEMRGGLLPGLLLAGALILAPSAAADSASDLQAVFGDFRDDRDVSACRYTTEQLQNALGEASKVADIDAYVPGFRDEVRREIARNNSGGCGHYDAFPGGLRIASIRPRGGPRKESVTIRNATKGTVRLRGLSLRDRSGHKIGFPRGLELKRSRRLRVVSGCFKGRRKALRRRGALFACKRKQLWNDKGDVVKLVSPQGKVIAQRGYGRFRRVARF
jgi:Lamin Tail Domain